MRRAAARAGRSAQLGTPSWRSRGRGLHAAASTAPAAHTRSPARPALPRELHITLPPGCKVPPTTAPVLHQVLEHYAARTPRLGVVLDKVTRPGWPGVEALGHDHFAFRTFGVPGLGIASLERVLLPLGYSRVHDDPPLAFPAKKLAATWFRASDPAARALLPRVFVSELQVEKLSPRAQEVIARAAGWAAAAPADEVMVQVMSSLLTGTAPWPTPTLADYETLMAESEYAAWVLAHGYSLNHTALALHRLPPPPTATAATATATGGPGADITDFNGRLQAAGLDLNPEGGLVKVSPDKLLLQSAVVADRIPFSFACGAHRDIAAAYVEFVQRLRLPQHSGLAADQVREEHLREGFEVGNADRIFESTTLAAGAKK